MKALITKLVSSDAGIAALVLRVPVGLTLAAHGAQKLFAWFGGYGLEGTGQYMASLGLEPGFLMALLAGSVQGVVVHIAAYRGPFKSDAAAQPEATGYRM